MTYSIKNFSKDFEKIISDSCGKIDYEKIADWAFKTNQMNCRDIDPDVDRWLIELGTVSMGPEFEMSESQLREYIFLANQIMSRGD